MRAIAIVVLLSVPGCAVRPRTLPATHATSATAPTGRLAGAPPALRPGVVDYKDVPAMREGAPVDEHQHHHTP
jgi:hypothetical protein